mmetsp:Transcript_6427/g.19892  ORF Transcript_6427/g.19892 Transcript_6427/m.19892 type:complete len:206 (-) Transcript_6427:1334-1951(-)
MRFRSKKACSERRCFAYFAFFMTFNAKSAPPWTCGRPGRVRTSSTLPKPPTPNNRSASKSSRPMAPAVLISLRLAATASAAADSSAVFEDAPLGSAGRSDLGGLDARLRKSDWMRSARPGRTIFAFVWRVVGPESWRDDGAAGDARRAGVRSSATGGSESRRAGDAAVLTRSVPASPERSDGSVLDVDGSADDASVGVEAAADVA